MSEHTYLVTLPNGRLQGPLLLREIKKALREGALPPDATIVLGGEKMTLSHAIAAATRGVGTRMTAEERAILADTRASTPQALLAEAEKFRRS